MIKYFLYICHGIVKNFYSLPIKLILWNVPHLRTQLFNIKKSWGIVFAPALNSCSWNPFSFLRFSLFNYILFLRKAMAGRYSNKTAPVVIVQMIRSSPAPGFGGFLSVCHSLRMNGFTNGSRIIKKFLNPAMRMH